jgi:peptidyl-dipeptidase Dcp
MKNQFIIFFIVVNLIACTAIKVDNANAQLLDQSTGANMSKDNPFLSSTDLYMNYPRFDLIEPEHYHEGITLGMADHLKEINVIATHTDPPSIENTLIALERSGRLLDKVVTVFYAMSSTNTSDAIDEIEAEFAPKLAAHQDQIVLNPQLFNRIDTLYQQSDALSLDAETKRLLDETHEGFVRAGAGLSSADQERLRAINTEMAILQTQFDQNVLDERNRLAVVVNDVSRLTGLSQAAIDRAASEAASRGLEGQYAIPLVNTSSQPYLSVLEDRSLRQEIMEASLARNYSGQYSNTEVIVSASRLRAERASLLGYSSHAAYGLSNQTAQTVKAVNERLMSLSQKAVVNAQREAGLLQDLITSEGHDFELASWDWPYYSDKLKQQLYSFDETELMVYLEMNNILEKGVFYAAHQVYGVSFKERFDLPVYQEDVRVFDVIDADGTMLGMFIFDPYARANKRGGAWMNSYAPQSTLLGTLPIVANHLNVTKPSSGEATLLTFDEVTTMFHEFGHALHGLLSNVYYPSLSGTAVPRDFVEYPSQVNEMWSTWPEVLQNYATHYLTGETMPAELLNKVIDSEQFNQGYATVEYLAASVIDMELHQLSVGQLPTAKELAEFEVRSINKYGLNLNMVPPRYKSVYFSHIMGGYSAGYYAYIWSEVLDADTVAWFNDGEGSLRGKGDHLRSSVLSRGNTQEVMSLYYEFRGRDADVNYLLKRRGLN